MLFSRRFRYKSSLSEEDIRERLVSVHLKIHKLDFEIYEKGDGVRIIPHVEQVQSLKTLPIIHVSFSKKENLKTQVVITAHMRKIDQGGPMLIVAIAAIMVLSSIIFGLTGKLCFAISLALIGLFVFIILWFRLETGYFDYVRKIRDYVKYQMHKTN